ncbi:tetratricopeptide repeat protein [Pseudomarimonas salicorniae]|uniref:Tetratricopeptide repeat protein n=1 Tax=Pseudomarimonas salicorniae TaxID=2933270 RepID=A0ABT0GF68_9GAMM|nr:tetratricopeptide repeat protein [Lysobacter sp. CAU 1642]MCK7592997.1 tetratricopeptide repeat protein [Lysobacter sp. CAU 1642]
MSVRSFAARGLLATLLCVAALGALADEAGLARLDASVRAAIEQAEARVDALPKEAKPAARADALEQLAKVLLAHDQYEAATSAFDRALALAPQRFSLHYLRALSRLSMGDVDAAMTGFDRALALNSGYVAGWLRRGELRLSRGNLEGARADFDQAQALDPQSAAALAGLGRTALQAGQLEEAAEKLTEALRRAPGAGRLRTPLALALRQLGRTDEARAVLAERNDEALPFADPVFEAVASLRRNPALIYEEGRQLAERGNLPAALKALGEAVALAPEEPVFLTEHGRVLLMAGQVDEAEKALGRATGLAPRQPLAAELHARVALARGDADAARSRLQRALELIPEADDLRVELARLEFRQGSYEAAARAFDALASRVEGAELSYARYWGGLAHALAGDCAKAQASLRDVFDASGGRDGWAMLGLARLGALCPADAAARDRARGWADTLHRQHPGVETAVTAALHAAADGDFERALTLQQQALDAAVAGAERLEHVASLKATLEGYRQRRLPERAYLAGSGLLDID